jgi:predicted O-methyltransferase YrrM
MKKQWYEKKFLNSSMKFSSQIKLYRKLRYRKGHGIHSPFIYNLITKVIEEKTPYYVFEDIEQLRKELLNHENHLGILTAQETQPKNYGALLFRLVNFFKCRTILQTGGSTGLMSLYLALPLRNSCECYVLEERNGLSDAVRTFAENYSLKNLYWMEGAYEENLLRLKPEITSFDFIFINAMGDSEKTSELLRSTETFIYQDTVMVIDNIRCDKAMKKLWQEIKNRTDVRLTIDLLSLGLVFFDPRLHKQHYKNYFDDGKKQNLHEKRRRGHYFFGWRKKGIQSQPAHRCLRND